MALRLYADLSMPNGLWQNTFIGFIGFKNDHINAGAEASFKSNLDMIRGHHAWGISGTGGISLSEKTEIFARYDFSTSVKPGSEPVQWNHQKDGSFVIAGVQYTFNSNTKIALDYQKTIPIDKSIQASDLIYINALFKF